MNSTRLFRILVCALVICSLLINCSPIRAKAVAVEASIAIGLIAMMILASAGVVYTASTTNQIQAIGNSFQTHMYQWGTSAEKLDEVDAFFNGLHLYDPGSGDDDETPHEKQVRLARGILAGIALWVGSLALGDKKIEDEQSLELYTTEIAVPFGNNGFTHMFKSDAPFGILYFQRNSDFFLCVYTDSDVPIEHKMSTVSNWSTVTYDGSVGETKFYYTGITPTVGYDYSPSCGVVEGSSNYNCAGKAVSSILGSSETVFIEPDTYVGDIPDQLQNGELEPEDIPLPDLNLEPYIEDGKLAPQKVIDTMSNLSTGALPYDQFLQQSTLPPEIDDGGTDSDSGTSSDTWQPPSNPGQFALDLTKYFPFCIPFDLYDLFTCLNADPVAPVIRWELPMPGGSTYPIELDLSPFNSVAQLLRRMQLLLFCVGLAIKTRDLIKG